MEGGGEEDRAGGREGGRERERCKEERRVVGKIVNKQHINSVIDCTPAHFKPQIHKVSTQCDLFVILELLPHIVIITR